MNEFGWKKKNRNHKIWNKTNRKTIISRFSVKLKWKRIENVLSRHICMVLRHNFVYTLSPIMGENNGPENLMRAKCWWKWWWWCWSNAHYYIYFIASKSFIFIEANVRSQRLCERDDQFCVYIFWFLRNLIFVLKFVFFIDSTN